MKTAYLDAFSGLSGDMIVGALMDLGIGLDEFQAAIESIPLTGYRVSLRRKSLSGISAAKFDVEVNEPQPERHLGDILKLIDASGLAPSAKRRASAIFDVLAKAEAKIHQSKPSEVHFHEVGAVDSIIDVVGAAWALDRLEIGDLIVSPLPAGSGFVRSRHGVIPVPAPATLELLTGFPLKLNDGESEMVTPTGAAVAAALARPAQIPLGFQIERVGYGAGSKEFNDRPNLLRVILGHGENSLASDELIEIQTNVDDLNPQIYEHLGDRLLAAGARDVTITPVLMKKGRPGVTLSVLAPAAERDPISAILFSETTTIGVRYHHVSRLKLDRKIIQVDTPYGPIRTKVSGYKDGVPLTVSPEYEDCREAAVAHGVALRVVIDKARESAHRHLKSHEHD